jgi:type VI protein secretion system component VasK
MVATLLRLVGIDLKRLARETGITIVLAMLAMLGVFAAMVALALCFTALYLWLELKLGTFAALGILSGTSALLAGVLFAVAFLRASRKPRARAEGALRAAANPVQASTAAIAQAADEAVNGAADIVRNGSRQQIAGTIAVAALIGWVLGRRF